MNQSRTDADDVRDASDQYYDALEALLNVDAGPIAEIWSREDDVTTMTEIGGREEGWDAVSRSWEDVAAVCAGGTVTRPDQLVRVVGDAAYELCTESLSAIFAGEPLTWENRATNIYRKENGEWKLVHEHADPDPELTESVASVGG